MKMTGFGIREALRRWQLKRDTANSLFDGSLRKFADDEKEHPQEIMKAFALADVAIAKLQTAQQLYNLTVLVDVQGNTMTLSEAVKLIGGVGRMEKMWRSGVAPKRERYALREDEVRKDDEVRSVQVMKTSEMLSEAERAARLASALRFAIAQGNIQEVDLKVQGLEPFMLA